MTLQERLEVRKEKEQWRLRMLNLYPKFTHKKWAMNTWRINHPQVF